MTAAADLVAALQRRFPDCSCAVDGAGVVTADVAPTAWAGAAAYARDELDCTYFDWLTAVDEQAAGLGVVLHLWSVRGRHHLLLRTLVPPRADGTPGRLATLTGVFRGAAWHEREAAEMFGLAFAGHPDPRPLLLPDGFEGHPLRKDFVLAARVARTWPGAKEPGESDATAARAPSRRRLRPPGAPDPAQWRAASGADARRPDAEPEPGEGDG